MTVFKRFLQDQTASAAVEYGLIGALISVANLAAILQLSANLSFDSIATLVSDTMK
ncbi:Flp family type IVb pilin [Mesorhizobium sp. RMAD-H1]|uniref:Flp family type IVb pilin n=1 Tax=Mesorhizobium sp. RMAD-H1 TaxID=2587065 RepID=UPI0016200992|nr:Flp family type IVb pilin [Mesorhizobium sp. RMAD-H1]MBB2971969.1 Flp pilus assembly pilin Flp [Mesorhizobium sp. RMAD-H1]